MPDDNWDYSKPRAPKTDWVTQAPITTYLLAAVCVLVTAAALTSSSIHIPVWQRIGTLGDAGAEDVWSGDYGPLLTSVFQHANVLHIAFNMYWLVMLGRLMERSMPVWAYVAFLAAAAIVSSATELAISSSLGIGASGVVYAMMGLMWAGRGRYPEWRAVATNENLRLFLLWAVFCIIGTYLHVLTIANGAHVGGFLFGASVGWLFVAPRRNYAWLPVLAALLIVNVLAVTWMPWSHAWVMWKAGH